MIELELRANDRTVHHFRFDQDVVFIGRDPKNDICFEDRSASRHHARILRSAQGYELEDLDSRNGTKVNERVAQHAILQADDQIRIGGHTLVVLSAELELAGSAEEPAPAAELERTKVAVYGGAGADFEEPGWSLLVERDGQVFATLPLLGERTTLGRDPGSDVVLADEDVSRHHARLIRKHGKYYVEDLDSLNGTLVNGEPVYTYKLSASTEMRIGPYLLRLVPPTAAQNPEGQGLHQCASCGRAVSGAWASCPFCAGPPPQPTELTVRLEPLKAPDPAVAALAPSVPLRLTEETLASERHFWVSFEEPGEVRHPIGQVPDQIRSCPRCLHVAAPGERLAVCARCGAARLGPMDLKAMLAEWSRRGRVQVRLGRVAPRPAASAMVEVVFRSEGHPA
jgi:pSer/pThr/pTyr-binding forkhead associated (FHA) protein